MAATESIPAPLRTPWAAVAAVASALAVFAAAQGLSYPLFTLVMKSQGYSPAMIGLSSATMPLGLLFSAALVPRVVGLIGARRLAVLCAVLGAACFLAIGMLQNAFAWFGVRFLIGFVINPLYILGEVWALALAAPAQRGRVMGFFNTLMSVGYASGPLALAAFGAASQAPFLVGVGAFLGCAMMLAAVSGRVSDFSREDGAPPGGLFAFARQAPAMLAAVGVTAATQMSIYSLLPLFGADHGLNERAAAALLTVLSAGNILLQVPLGLMAERHGGRAMVLFCAVMTVACAGLLPLLIETPAIWPLLLVMGGVAYGTYTMSSVELGERFSGRTLVAGNAAFALSWGAGGIVGAPVSGSAMEALGPIGLPATIAALTTAMLLFVSFRTLRRRASP